MASVLDEVTALGHIRRRKLFIQHRRQFDALLAQLDERWTLEICVRRLRATRSQQANAYWWGVCVALVSEHTGYTPEEVHEIAKQMFLPKRMAFQNGNGEVVGEFVMGGSTRGLDTKAFSEFTDRFKHWAMTELDVYIPDPNEPVHAL